MDPVHERPAKHHWFGPPRASQIDDHGLGVLDESTCLDLLREERVGRVGFSAHALPVIFPVNFVVEGRSVLFSSDQGEKLRAAEAGSVACFEVDWFDPLSHDGWSVLATGRLATVDELRATTLLHDHPLAHWAIEGDRQLVELPIEMLSGRRIRNS